MKQEDIIPEEEIIPPDKKWYQRKGCIFSAAFLSLFLLGACLLAWQISSYYHALKTGNITPQMREFLGDVLQDDQIKLVTRDDDPALGPDNAKVVVVFFEDFQCPLCGQLFEEMKPIREEYKDRILFVYRDYPTRFDFSQKAAEAGECADEQARFWDYHDLLFSNQDQITSEEALIQFAEQLNLDTVSFEECLKTGRYEGEVNKDLLDAHVAGVVGTPTTYINGYKVEGPYPAEFWRQSFDYLLEELN